MKILDKAFEGFLERHPEKVEALFESWLGRQGEAAPEAPSRLEIIAKPEGPPLELSAAGNGRVGRVVHHILHDPAGCEWFKSMPEPNAMLRAMLQDGNLSDEQLQKICDSVNRPYSEIVFGAPLTVNDLKHSFAHKIRSS